MLSMPHFDPQFRQEIKTKKVLFIDDEKFLSRIARDLRGQNIMQIKSMHNDSTIVGTYLDNVTKYDNGQYPLQHNVNYGSK